MNVAGNGRDDNAGKELNRIPHSPFFQFEGAPEMGLTVTSSTNDLALMIGPIPLRTRCPHERPVIAMGTAAAMLTWQGRSIPGRVSYEGLIVPDFHRLSRTYFRLWNDFQRPPVLAGQGGDIYLHSQRRERLAALVGRLAGFAAFDEQAHPVNALHMEVLARDRALGFSRWPTARQITWNGANGPASTTWHLSDRTAIANWVIGEFSRASCRAEPVRAGRTWRVYGLAESIA